MKKLLLGLGTIAAVTAPVVSVVACSSVVTTEDDSDSKQMARVIAAFDKLKDKLSNIKNHKQTYPMQMHSLSPETVGFREPDMPEGFEVKYTFFPDLILGGFRTTAFITNNGVTRFSQFEILGFKTNTEVFDNYVNFCEKIKGLSGKTTLAKALELNNQYLVDKSGGGLIPSKPEDMGFVSPVLPPEVDSISYSLEVSSIPGTINIGAIIFPSDQAMMAGGNLMQEHFSLTGFGTKPGITYLY